MIICVRVRGAKSVATVVVFNRGAKRRRFSVEPSERLYRIHVYVFLRVYVCVCVQYNKMAFSIERQ
jgi:hypothetical protein